jgi:hypothetical protein
MIYGAPFGDNKDIQSEPETVVWNGVLTDDRRDILINNPDVESAKLIGIDVPNGSAQDANGEARYMAAVLYCEHYRYAGRCHLHLVPRGVHGSCLRTSLNDSYDILGGSIFLEKMADAVTEFLVTKF